MSRKLNLPQRIQLVWLLNLVPCLGLGFAYTVLELGKVRKQRDDRLHADCSELDFLDLVAKSGIPLLFCLWIYELACAKGLNLVVLYGQLSIGCTVLLIMQATLEHNQSIGRDSCGEGSGQSKDALEARINSSEAPFALGTMEAKAAEAARRLKSRNEENEAAAAAQVLKIPDRQVEPLRRGPGLVGLALGESGLMDAALAPSDWEAGKKDEDSQKNMPPLPDNSVCYGQEVVQAIPSYQYTAFKDQGLEAQKQELKQELAEAQAEEQVHAQALTQDRALAQAEEHTQALTQEQPQGQSLNYSPGLEAAEKPGSTADDIKCPRCASDRDRNFSFCLKCSHVFTSPQV